MPEFLLRRINGLAGPDDYLGAAGPGEARG